MTRLWLSAVLALLITTSARAQTPPVSRENVPSPTPMGTPVPAPRPSPTPLGTPEPRPSPTPVGTPLPRPSATPLGTPVPATIPVPPGLADALGVKQSQLELLFRKLEQPVPGKGFTRDQVESNVKTVARALSLPVDRVRAVFSRYKALGGGLLTLPPGPQDPPEEMERVAAALGVTSAQLINTVRREHGGVAPTAGQREHWLSYTDALAASAHMSPPALRALLENALATHR